MERHRDVRRISLGTFRRGARKKVSPFVQSPEPKYPCFGPIAGLARATQSIGSTMKSLLSRRTLLFAIRPGSL